MFDPEIHHRRSIRLQGFDYSSAGGYFITTNTLHRAHLFGKIVNGEMILSQAGEIVRQRWLAMPSVFPVVELDEFVVMPDHFHAILVIRHPEKSEPAPPTVGEVVRAFKAVSARTINREVSRIGTIWQRNYFERIIRTARQWENTRTYIRNNPANW